MQTHVQASRHQQDFQKASAACAIAPVASELIAEAIEIGTDDSETVQ